MNKYKYLAENVIVFALGSVLSKVVLFLLLAVFTKYMTTQEYGDAELLITTVSLLLPIFTLSISDASLRFIFGNDNRNSIVSNGVFVTIAGCIALILLCPLLTFVESLRPYLPYIISLFLFNSLEVLFFNINKGFERVKLCAFNSLVSVGVITICSFWLIVNSGLGIQGYLLSIIFSHIICCIYLFVGGRLDKLISFSQIDFSLCKKMLLYSIPFVPSTIAWWINSLSDRYLIVFILGSSLNGLYSAAAKIPNVISIFTTIFHQAWQLSGIKESSNSNYSEFYTNIYNIFSVVIITFSAILIAFLPALGGILFKGEFVDAWSYVPFLIIGAVFSGLSGVLSPAYLAAKKTGTLMISTIVGSCINILINIVFLKIIGLQAAAISTFISFIIVWGIRLFLLNKYITIRVNWAILIISVILLIYESIVVMQKSSFTILSYLLCAVICIINLMLLKPYVVKIIIILKNKNK